MRPSQTNDASLISSVLSCPVAHLDMDGSGRLCTAFEDMVISKGGDVFAVNSQCRCYRA